MNRRHRDILHYVKDISTSVLIVCIGLYFVALAVESVTSTYTSTKCERRLAEISDRLGILCGAIGYEGRCMRALFSPRGSSDRRVVYTYAALGMNDSEAPRPLARYVNVLDCGNIEGEASNRAHPTGHGRALGYISCGDKGAE